MPEVEIYEKTRLFFYDQCIAKKDKEIRELKKEREFWHGKWAILRLENNKLRSNFRHAVLKRVREVMNWNAAREERGM